MKKTVVVTSLVVGLLVPTVVWAQGFGGPGGGPGGGMRRSPKFRLTGLVRGIGELEKGKAPLTRAQAKQVVTLLTPWQKKPTMTEDEGKALYMKMNAVLTTKHKNELDKVAALRRRTARGDGGGPGGPGGGPPDTQQMQQMRQQMQKMRGFMQTYNPFYPPTSYKELKSLPERMRTGFTRRYQTQKDLLARLARKAK